MVSWRKICERRLKPPTKPSNESPRGGEVFQGALQQKCVHSCCHFPTIFAAISWRVFGINFPPAFKKTSAGDPLAYGLWTGIFENVSLKISAESTMPMLNGFY